MTYSKITVQCETLYCSLNDIAGGALKGIRRQEINISEDDVQQ